ncbi:hypothetical protein [Bacillus sp. Marseille-Q3570]|uniref:hypothetical protein n=1 Tax=Bacillus sp. Marseille-Q3570 TaxID=2963522 RepID=UPI0021B73340|nr:hypothetical protein [Bacillus sp. Marseille-Q3570]
MRVGRRRATKRAAVKLFFFVFEEEMKNSEKEGIEYMKVQESQYDVLREPF